jgi:hypothetical protein
MAYSNNKTTSREKPLNWPLFLGISFILVIALGWILEAPSREELFGDTGKIWDHLKIPLGGWSPNFMLGHSGLVYDAYAIAITFSSIANTLLAWLVGPFIAQKLLILSFIPLSALSMWFFIRRIGASSEMASLVSLCYIILPSIHVAIGVYEHWTVGLCFVFTPLILRGILAVAEEGSPREIVGLGVAAAALALSYTKIAVVMSPMLLLWTLEVLRQNHAKRRQALIGYGWSILVAMLTAVLILLPASREFGFAAGFLFDPLDAWKHHYAFKTPLLWIDLWGFLTKGGDGNLTGDAAMFQIGLIPLGALSLALGLPALREWRASPLGRWFLILTACWLLSIWFASGQDGITLGHLHVLKTAQGLPDSTIPMLWLSLIWIGWLIFQTTFQLLKEQVITAAWITLLVLVFPIFRIAELFPLFHDIRAPESFWSVGGFCALSAAVGLAFWMLFSEIVQPEWRKSAVFAVGFLLLVELYPIHSAYWTRGMDRQLFTEYDQAAEFLKTAPLQGRVHPLSSRYFYLTLPEKAGRAIDSESLLRHFQLKWVRHLEVAGSASGEALKPYLNLVGVAYILIDKEDPFTPKQMQDFFRASYPVVFENHFFVVLANPGTLYPAFLAHDFVALPPESYAMAPAALQLLPQNLITVEMPNVDQQTPGFAGMAKAANQIQLLSGYQGKLGQLFIRVPLVGNRMDDYQRMIYQLPPTVSGWLVVTEAYHPDWTVMIDGKPAVVHRAEGALLSTYVPVRSHEVVFQFKPPVWYAISLFLGAISWILALAALLFLPSRWAPARWRRWWVGGMDKLKEI